MLMDFHQNLALDMVNNMALQGPATEYLFKSNKLSLQRVSQILRALEF